ncbi:MAG: Ig-like domain-containing protein [Gemmatimonadota bacterium]|nr:Ig-like domain-containing protein [Gemmatimonadota bacterium]
MRLNFRLATGVALVLGAISCSSATGELTASRASDVSAVRLALSPTFSPAAARAYSALAAGGADITNIHIVLTDLGGKVAADTTVAFPVSLDSISIDLLLSIQGREEQFDAKIDLRDATGAILFSTTQRVTARNASLPSVPQAPLVLQYVGPGFSAKTVSVSPGDATLFPGATQSVIATGADAAGFALGDLSVVWTSSDPAIVQVTPTGPASALLTARGPRGTVTLTARTLSGVAGSSKVSVVPTASALNVFGGAGQSGFTLDTLTTPFTVEVRASDGGTVAGALVTFSAVTAGGAAVTSSASTDANGRASTLMVLGRDAGTYTYQASSGPLTPVTVSASGTLGPIGPAAQIIPLTSLPSSFKAGVTATQRFSGQLADRKGYYVRQAGVVLIATMDITPNSGAKSQRVIRATSDAEGVLTLPIPSFDAPGSVFITINVPDLGLTLSGTFTIN